MRGAIKFFSTLIIGVALIWLGLWWYAECRMKTGFVAWTAQLGRQGWQVSYDSVDRGTYLPAAEITVRNLDLIPPAAPEGRQFSLALPTLTLRLRAIDPLVLHTDLPDKIALNVSDAPALVISTGGSALAEDLNPHSIFHHSPAPFRGGSFAAEDLEVLASAGSLPVLHIDKIASQSLYDSRAGTNATAISIKTTLDGLALSPLLSRLAGLPFGGQLAHLDIALRLSGPLPPELGQMALPGGDTAGFLIERERAMAPVIHHWAALGGSGDAAIHLTLGPSTLAASGTLGFDTDAQPQGTADLTADHLDQFTAAWSAYPSVQAGIAESAARMSPYIGNSATTGQTLALHLTYGRPGVFIGGQHVADMPLVNWEAPGNPPTASAPGH